MRQFLKTTYIMYYNIIPAATTAGALAERRKQQQL